MPFSLMSATCKKCGMSQFARTGGGFFREVMLPLLGLSPWKCVACGHATYNRNGPYRRNGYDPQITALEPKSLRETLRKAGPPDST